MKALKPIGPQLFWDNRKILAKRGHWPAGALEACERLSRAHSGWTIFYMSANETLRRAAGYSASRGGMHEWKVFAASPEKLARMIRDAPPAKHDYSVNGCAVCAAEGERRRRRAGL